MDNQQKECPGLMLKWEDVWCCVQSKKKIKKRDVDAHANADGDFREKWQWVLRGVSGQAVMGSSLAILGPSGSGKTTLLGALGKKIQRSSSIWVSGKVDVPLGCSVAYVPQDAPFFSKLTVNETLEFVAKMEGFDCKSQSQSQTVVEAAIRRFGLDLCGDTLVGGETTTSLRGISGGERRRLAIACELIRSESNTQKGTKVLIADEPTTGLDAFQADKVVSHLLSIARDEEALVVMSIHQPRSAIFHRLDDIMLLGPGGRCCYLGPAKDATRHFKHIGYPCPEGHNPAEFLVDLVSIDTQSAQSESESWARVKHIRKEWLRVASPVDQRSASVEGNASADLSEEQPRTTGRKRKKVGLLTQLGLLLRRNFTQTVRERRVQITRALGTTVLAFAFGSCHFKLGFGQKSIRRRAAVMLQICINSSLMATIKTLNSFPREKTVVQHELSKKRMDGTAPYGVGPYFLSKILVEAPIDALFPMLFGAIVGPLSGLNRRNRLPFLLTLALQGISASSLGMSVGAFAPSTETALAVGPIAMVLSIMLGDSGGMFAEIPKVLQPVSRFSVIKWGFDGVLASEFSGLRFTCDLDDDALDDDSAIAREVRRRMCIETGEDVLESMGLAPASITSAAVNQAKLILYNLGATYMFLRLGGSGSSVQPFADIASAPLPLKLE